MEPIIIFMIISFLFMSTVLFIEYQGSKSMKMVNNSIYFDNFNNLDSYNNYSKQQSLRNFNSYNKYFGPNTKCFSCESQMPANKKYASRPTKCFSCEQQAGGFGNPTKCFSCGN